MIEEIKKLMLEDLKDHEILSLDSLSNQYGGYTRKPLKKCDGFSIWGVFSIKNSKSLCLYTQDSKAKIKFYDPLNETLSNYR